MRKTVQQLLKKEQQPMCQHTYWIIYLAVGFVYVIKTVEASAHASYDVLIKTPEIAQHSWLVNPFFFL